MRQWWFYVIVENVLFPAISNRCWVAWVAVSCVNIIDQTQAAQTNLFTKIDILLC